MAGCVNRAPTGHVFFLIPTLSNAQISPVEKTLDCVKGLFVSSLRRALGAFFLGIRGIVLQYPHCLH